MATLNAILSIDNLGSNGFELPNYCCMNKKAEASATIYYFIARLLGLHGVCCSLFLECVEFSSESVTQLLDYLCFACIC